MDSGLSGGRGCGECIVLIGAKFGGHFAVAVQKFFLDVFCDSHGFVVVIAEFMYFSKGFFGDEWSDIDAELA